MESGVTLNYIFIALLDTGALLHESKGLITLPISRRVRTEGRQTHGYTMVLSQFTSLHPAGLIARITSDIVVYSRCVR